MRAVPAGGRFKFRGAYNKIATLPAEQRARGIIAFSSGNHAQAVALTAQIFGVPAVICMPTDAPEVKVMATRGYGAEIVRYDRMTEDREALARRLAEERGLTLVPPYNDAAIIAGAGTAARELLEDVPDLDVIVAPTGGGGLISARQSRRTAYVPISPSSASRPRRPTTRGSRCNRASGCKSRRRIRWPTASARRNWAR